MDVAAPQSWAEARLDTSAPRDRAPLLAILGAIEERAAVARLSPIPGEPMPGGALLHGLLGGNDGPRYPGPTAAYLSGIVGTIRELQGNFISFAPPYGDSGFAGFPDHLASDSHLVGAVPPYDALARIPLVPGPAPADSTAAAATRAFYAWCRASLDEMACIVSGKYDISVARTYSAGGSTYASLAAIVADAQASAGGSWYDYPRLSISGEYNRWDGPYFTGLSIPVGIAVRNPTPMPAAAGFACVAEYWPADGAWDDGESYSFASFGAPGIGAAPGISSISVPVAANGGTAVLWTDPGSCPVPSYEPPASMPSNVDPDEWLWDFSASCKIVPFLDFSDSFRFHADTATP